MRIAGHVAHAITTPHAARTALSCTRREDSAGGGGYPDACLQGVAVTLFGRIQLMLCVRVQQALHLRVRLRSHLFLLPSQTLPTPSPVPLYPVTTPSGFP
ncbi:hypothetical protein CYMTET_45928 [Cymbomonas tetramitiformis]|uniref:Uncharacterized protein n=1 Tax=Cymbomonas tetramitiformis TaxID=36881 RepID=A0AAE0BYD7_9CHLO|nr:hypothetical protein CYMTET_45928 [Cymbomonas tetramitiformis]